MSSAIVEDIDSEFWCTTQLCHITNIDCHINDLSISEKASEFGVPDKLADQVTIWGVVALDLGLPNKDALGFQNCSQVLAFYWLNSTNVDLALKFQNDNQIEALKLFNKFNIHSDIVLSINDEESLNKLKTLLYDFGPIQIKALNTNKIHDLDDVYRFTEWEQAKALEIDGINMTQAIQVNSSIVLTALQRGIDFQCAQKLSNQYQLEAILKVPCYFALKFNTSEKIDNLNFFSGGKTPSYLEVFNALYLTPIGVESIKNMSKIYNKHMEHDKQILNIQKDTPDKAFNLTPVQEEALIVGIPLSLIGKVFTYIQVEAAKIDGIKPEEAIKFIKEIHIKALQNGANATFAPKFNNKYQLSALEHDVAPELAVKFTEKYQIDLLQLSHVTHEEALAMDIVQAYMKIYIPQQCTFMLLLTSIIGGIYVNYQIFKRKFHL